MIVFASFSSTFFVRDVVYINEATPVCVVDIAFGETELKTYKGNNVIINFDDNGFEIKESFKYNLKERLQILTYVKESDKRIRRSIQNMEGEWIFHTICYNLDVGTEHAKNAFIEYREDERFTVRFMSILLQILGI